MAGESGESPRTDDATDNWPFGYSMLSIPEDKSMAKLYSALTPEQRTWRCEQTKKSADLMEKAWELLRPICDGRWDKEKAYTGQALFLKAIYEGQGYAPLHKDLGLHMSDIMRAVQEHMPYVTSGGRRVQADDSPARFALRVAFMCVTHVTASGLAYGMTNKSANWEKEVEELQTQALQWCVGCMDKLGGQFKHEGTLSAEEKGLIARLATSAGEELQAMVGGTPMGILALFMLQVQYDMELRVLKWVLTYVASRCAKEIYARERAKPGASRGTPATAAARSAWLAHSAALGKLDGESSSPVSAFMVAEARSAEGATPEALSLMRTAAAAAERRGDDLVGWLARLNVAQLLVHGAGGPTFAEDDVLQEMDAASVQKSSAKRWGGAVLLDSRCRTLRAALQKTLKEAREMKQHKQQSAAAAGSDGGGSEDDGRLPSVILEGQWGALTPVEVPARECAGCKKMFHKASTCARCKQVWYCGKACQMAHWKAGHKKECAQLANAAARAAKAAEDEEDD